MDDKKEKKSSGNPIEEGFLIAFMVFLTVMFLARVLAYFKTGDGSGGFSNAYIESITGGPNGWYANTLHFIGVTVDIYVKIATVFSIVTFLAIIYVSWLTNRLAASEARKDKEAEVKKEMPSEQSQKWQMVLAHANSQNAAEWRLSILEADVMLEDLLQSLGYMGQSLGEKLKNVHKGDFKTIDYAWEAHKIRNMIAHEGTDFPITQQEVKRVIQMYNAVFNEFKYV